MTPRHTTRELLTALIRKSPTLSLAEVADRLEVTRARVQQLLAAEGFTYEPPQPGRWVLRDGPKTKPKRTP